MLSTTPPTPPFVSASSFAVATSCWVNCQAWQQRTVVKLSRLYCQRSWTKVIHCLLCSLYCLLFINIYHSAVQYPLSPCHNETATGITSVAASSILTLCNLRISSTVNFQTTSIDPQHPRYRIWITWKLEVKIYLKVNCCNLHKDWIVFQIPKLTQHGWIFAHLNHPPNLHMSEKYTPEH